MSKSPASLKLLLVFLVANFSFSVSYAFPDTLWANSADSAVFVGSNLVNGVDYEIEVMGTHSVWGPFYWGQGVCPGTEPMPIFSNGINNEVGRDIFFRFGGPSCCTACPTPPGSLTHSDFRFSLDGSAPSLNFNSLAGPLTYSPTHQYTSNITGQGQAIRWKFFDQNTSDNAGMYRFVIRETAVSVVPILSQWGLILFGLVLLCFGGIALYRRGAVKALQD